MTNRVRKGWGITELYNVFSISYCNQIVTEHSAKFGAFTGRTSN